MKTSVGLIIDGKLVAYKDAKEVEISYKFKEDLIGFVVNEYDEGGNLIIDPQLVWRVYYLEEQEYYSSYVSIDKDNNVYVVGCTSSSNFPTYNPRGGVYFQGKNSGKSDVFIIKFNSKGITLWATYYGGANDDVTTSISIDNNSNVYIVGRTNSDDFPVYNPGGAYFQGNRNNTVSDYYEPEHTDIFIVKLNSKGIRLWATYYGGNNYDRAFSSFVDRSGNIYIVGYTCSFDFPTYNSGKGAYFQKSNITGLAEFCDAFILKFSSDGARLWSTYYGGKEEDVATCVSVDNSGNVYVVGYTSSADFPVYELKGAYFQGSLIDRYNAFILKFNSKGERLWATYYGGSEYDFASYVRTDRESNVYVVGHTSSKDFPVYNPRNGAYFQEDSTGGIFILKFNSNGERVWATYYGGEYYDYPTSIAIDNNNNLYIVGYTLSSDFPIYNPEDSAYFQDSIKGSEDGFIIKFNSKGVRLWSTYYGGNDKDYALSVFTDSNDNVYVVGETGSIDFPVRAIGEGAYFYEKDEDDYYAYIHDVYKHYDAFILKFTSKGVRLWSTYLRR